MSKRKATDVEEREVLPDPESKKIPKTCGALSGASYQMQSSSADELRRMIKAMMGEHGKEVVVVLTQNTVFVGCVYERIKDEEGQLYEATQRCGQEIAKKFTKSQEWGTPEVFDAVACSEGLCGNELTTVRASNLPAAIVQSFGRFDIDSAKLQKFEGKKILGVRPEWGVPSNVPGRLLYAGRAGSLIWRLP